MNNLEHFHDFYLTYPGLTDPAKFHAPSVELADASEIGISHAVRGKSRRGTSWMPGQLHPNLSWTHYRTLLRVDTAEARAFYEIEAIKNHWSAREFERQINSLLYERLALGKDKKGLMKLATKGHDVQRPADVFKDPMVMEFLGLHRIGGGGKCSKKARTKNSAWIKWIALFGEFTLGSSFCGCRIYFRSQIRSEVKTKKINSPVPKKNRLHLCFDTDEDLGLL